MRILIINLVNQFEYFCNPLAVEGRYGHGRRKAEKFGLVPQPFVIGFDGFTIFFNQVPFI